MLLLFSAALGATCASWSAPTPKPAVGGGIEESSGVAASRSRPGVFYTHEDGGPPRLYAFNLQGTLVDTIEIPGAELEDWEDIAAAPCPRRGDCLYIADIGDNEDARGNITIYVVEEPQEGKTKADVVERYTAVYPEGPQDAEALAVHPCTGDMYIFPKNKEGETPIYRLPFNPGEGTHTLEDLGTVLTPGLTADSRKVTGADWDLTGERLVLRTSDQVLAWWTDPQRPDAHWDNAPEALPGANEAQGEAVAFSLDGDLVSTSEGSPMSVDVFTCEETEPTEEVCVFPQTGGCGCSTPPSPRSLWWALWPLLLWARRR